jgi:hypothetical protein
MLLISQSRQMLNAIICVFLVGFYSPNIFAATITSKVQQLENEPTIQTLELSRDVGNIDKGDIITISTSSPLVFTVSEKVNSSDGTYSLSAQSLSGERLLMSGDRRASYGSISGKTVSYTIGTDAELGMILIDQRHQAFAEVDLSSDALVPPTRRKGIPGIDQITPAQKSRLERLGLGEDGVASKINGKSTITMLIIYSSEFAQGFASPTARINDLLNFTNASLSDSDVDITFTLALAQQLNFNNSLSTGVVLDQVTFGTGAFSGVAALRDQVGADMVAVLSFSDNSSANGVAWVNGNSPDFAFSSIRLSTRCCNSVFAHELGHNLGSQHERASVNDIGNLCNSNGFTEYSCGHGNASRNWGTIMSRLNSQIVGNVFSNPLSSDCLGEPCGIAEGQSGAADNTRSFNLARLLIENFREDPVVVPPVQPPSGMSNTDASGLPVIINLLLDDD